MTPSARARLYLKAIDDWKSAFEVAHLLGDAPMKPVKVVRSTLFGLVGHGLAEHHAGNDTFRITDAGRAVLLSSHPPKDPTP